MPSARQKPAAKSAARSRPAPPKKGAKPSAAKPAAKPSKPAPPSPAAKSGAKPASKSAAKEKVPVPELEVPLPGGRRHVLSLSFVRDGDEFLARLETDAGHITELKNRSLDQLLTLVASELEDLLE